MGFCSRGIVNGDMSNWLNACTLGSRLGDMDLAIPDRVLGLPRRLNALFHPSSQVTHVLFEKSGKVNQTVLDGRLHGSHLMICIVAVVKTILIVEPVAKRFLHLSLVPVGLPWESFVIHEGVHDNHLSGDVPSRVYCV